METINSQNFEIYFEKNSVAEKEQDLILDSLEKSYQKIISVLELQDNYPKIKYYLFPTKAKKISETGEDANAHTNRENFEVFAVYDEEIKPIGPHEIVHLLTNSIGVPNYVVNEGLAESFEEDWTNELKGELITLRHDEWVKVFKKEKTYISITDLFDDDKFWDYESEISYPECGSFVKYLLKNYDTYKIKKLVSGLERRGDFNQNKNRFEQILGKSLAVAEKEWLETIL